jgi:glyoxylase-like metal-dependent hydrolase (beta-lactamase superfamily II)
MKPVDELDRSNAVSRRAGLKLFAGAAAGALLARSASAQDANPPATVRNPDTVLPNGNGFYRHAVGALDVILVSDGTFPLSPPFPLFGANAGQEKVEAAFAEKFIKPADVLGHVNALLVGKGGRYTLVDSGCGELFGPTTGKLFERLANAGVRPEQIDAIVLTHFHPDHVGGLAGVKGKGALPNAKVVIAEAELKFLSAPDFSKGAVPAEIQAAVKQLASTLLTDLKPRLAPVSGEKEIAPGVTAVPAPGHTPGHMALQIADGNDALFYVTDAVHHHAIGFPHPDWYVGFDTDSDLAVKTRKALLDRAASTKVLIAGAHLPFPGFGHVARRGDAFEFVPVVWRW